MSKKPTPSDLTAAWKRLGPDDLVELLAIAGQPGWFGAANRVEGPCPIGVGKCRGDRRAAFAYVNRDGWPPYIRCHHKDSCAYQESLFQLLVGALGSPRAAARAVLRRGTDVVVRMHLRD